MHRNILVAIAALIVVVACGRSSPTRFDAADQQAVIQEVRQRLNEYSNAVTSKDIDAMLGFWSNSDDFVFAGDGAILGGYDQWSSLTRQDNEQTDHWVHWTWKNVHILPLSRNAASATLEFTYEKILTGGETIEGYGSWTYVFRHTGKEWKVIHANGHHPVR